jgi:hypothetical protein
MDETETETNAVETLETWDNALSGIGEAWSAKRTSGTWSRRYKSLANVP